jgi:hypothetical protein
MDSKDTDDPTPVMVVSLNVGLPAKRRYWGEEVLTGGWKGPVPRARLRFRASTATVRKATR